ncbi:hypothetical protein FRUB_03683 [Fimbriiglobus ruber]|uniref:DUF1559 domain-containing protein n=2 Tax=Fimbriiglobus ruber TaxID=1908690 RepID=A0A225DZ32_9BACT|nr:hypothetical protein FRUB_03683 [Fimbriiglobus ruber]
MVGERPPPDTYQAGWWYPGFHFSARGHRGPNGGLVAGAGLYFINDPCTIGKRTFGPGRLDNPCDRNHYWSLHPGGANFLFADGSVRFLSYAAEPIIIPLASINGGEIVQWPE